MSVALEGGGRRGADMHVCNLVMLLVSLSSSVCVCVCKRRHDGR